jgi:sugar phosphate permease
MLGIVYLPLAISVMPYVIASILPGLGRTTVLLLMAVTMIGTLPFLWFLLEKPVEGTGDKSQSVQAAATRDSTAGGDRLLTKTELFTNPYFWVLSVAMAILAGAGSVFQVHAVPFGTGRGMSLPAAAMLLSTQSIFGLPGTLLFGWASDRFGSLATLAFLNFYCGVLWLLLYGAGEPFLFVISALMGPAVTPIIMLHGAATAELFSLSNVSRAMGFGYLIKLPFLFGFVPVAALLFEWSGSYELPFMITAGLLFLNALGFLIIYFARPKIRDRAPAVYPA